ncbi:unnamed protein product [Amoebophrya sp. A25]|nr:unnamed protein product [Amoebophrya sp. A25]|eukprot:GSA25T00000976001.1
MISSIILLTQKGEILVLRAYKDNVTRVETQHFCEQIVAAKELKEKPIHQIRDCYFLHVTSGEVTIVATTKDDVNVVLIFKLLYKIVDLLKSYFGGANITLTEALIHRHFVLIYELLDEVLDFGYPQVMEAEVLKKYITQGGLKPVDLNDEENLKKITIQATGNCSWRAEGIKYRKNEVYIDVIESVNVLLSQSGTLLRADVSGQIMVKSQLSGMPECKFGMNDKLLMPHESAGVAGGRAAAAQKGGIVIDDCRFHQCVRLSKYDQEKTITFIPPDGTFELMSYRITENIQPPFRILPVVQERGRNRMEVSLKVKSLFEANTYATQIVITIPVPKCTARVNVQTLTSGKAKYEPEAGIVWRMRRFSGNTENTLSAEVELASDRYDSKHWVRPPISMDFQVPMFTATGLRVRFLRVQEKSNYRPVKWIRYITKAGSYQHRI